MIKVCKVLLLLFLDITGINALCRIFNRNRAIILFYHGICNEDFDLLKDYEERHTPKSSFRKHLDYLKKHGYVFVNMTELITSLKNKAKIEKYVVLTFDDGFKNIITNAYPIMQEFNAKGCCYLVSDLVGTNRLLWTDYVETVIRNWPKRDLQFFFKGENINYSVGDKRASENAMRDIKAKLRKIPDKERLKHLEQFSNQKLENIPEEFFMADWKQIKNLDPAILEVGGHTKNHPNCENLDSDDELKGELLGSKIKIEENTGRNVMHFCYPAGSNNDRVVKKVMEYGYESAVTTAPGFIDQSADRYRLKRIAAGKDSLLFKANISGSYHALRRLKAILRPGSAGDISLYEN